MELPLELYQDSSGGEHWDSRNHLNRDGRLAVRFPGYRLRAGDEESKGRRAGPVVVLDSEHGTLALTMRHFWQNFPKAVEASRAGLTLGLFPRQHAELHELQGGEQKTHCFALSLGRDPVAEIPLDWCRRPALPILSPQWHAECQSVPHLVPESQDGERAYVDLVRSAIEGEDAFVVKRERVDEYGWRHFGDLWADHEAVNQREPLLSHYNNQYDAVLGFAIQFFRSADPRWWGPLEELARHVIDIDVYHTDGDKSVYNHGMFWHTVHYLDAGLSNHRSYPKAPGSLGGGPSAGHLYATGLLLFHFLTGDPLARETVLELGRYVIDADDGSATIFRFLAGGETGHISSSGADDFHGPGRSAANSLNALLDAYRASSDEVFLRKAEALIRRTIHPRDDLSAMDLLNAELRWFYTIFLQSLGRYLDARSELGRQDEAFEYARRSLLTYADWTARNETPFLDRAETLEFPNETWAAQDMRKCELLQIAAKYTTEPERTKWLDRARYFYRSSLDQLSSFETRTLCRPVTLLLSNGYTRAFFESPLPAFHPNPNLVDIDVGSPLRFVPQKAKARRRLLRTVAIGILLVAVLGVVAGSCWRMGGS
jgi:hypothetical protein